MSQLEKIVRPYTPGLYEQLWAPEQEAVDAVLMWEATTSIDNSSYTRTDDPRVRAELYTERKGYSFRTQEVIYEIRAYIQTESTQTPDSFVWEDRVVLKRTEIYDIGAAQFGLNSETGTLPWPNHLFMVKEEDLLSGEITTRFDSTWASWRDAMVLRGVKS